MSGQWGNPNIPHSGWECIDVRDLGKPSMTCHMCEREIIRYVHYMMHPKYRNILQVGCICAGKMEGNSQNAKERDSFIRSRTNKRKKFLDKKWKISKNGNNYLKSDSYLIILTFKNGLWSAVIKNEKTGFDKWCEKKCRNENEMKLAAFDFITKILAEEKMIKIPVNIKPIDIKPNDEPITAKSKNKSEKISRKNIEYTNSQITQHDISEVSDVSDVSDVTDVTEVSETAERQTRFTDEQKNIFAFIANGKGHGIINAVAGAGKTTTIMECAKYAADQTSVLFCAFNKSIQTEIANKFSKQAMNQVTVKTIHALGFQMLNDNNNSNRKINVQEYKYHDILNSDTDVHNKINDYMEELLELSGYGTDENDNNKQFAVKDIIYKFKDKLFDMNQKIRATLTPVDFKNFKELIEHFNYFSETDIKSNYFNKELEIYFECSKILLEAGNILAHDSLIMDYTDMLYLPFIWNLSASKTYSFLFIDECQDLSKSQLAIVLKYGHKNGRILAVGDPYQSIYGFAGADIESFYRIKNTIKAIPLPLTICFRCPSKIVLLASDIRKDIKASKKEPGIIEEISFNQVVKLARSEDLVISRFREPILFLVFDFINNGKQVQIYKDEVNEIIDELKKIFKQEERELIIPEIQGGFETIKDIVYNRWNFIIKKEARKISNSSEKHIYIQSHIEYLNNKLEFLHKKFLQWKGSCHTINDMLIKIKDYISAAENCVKLSTIHRAKGLEARRVFILNFNDLPHLKPNQKPWERIQELNLKYVAITRAINELYLVKSEAKDNMKKDTSLFDVFL